MKRKSAQHGRPALDLIEDAVHLLRTTPARVWLAYYAGAIPFTLGLLFFLADMSCGAFAERRCPVYAFVMILLFVWLKCWQTGFTSALRARLTAVPPRKWDAPRVLRLILVQGIVQPSRMFILPVTFAAIVPFIWLLAFYENITVLGDGTGTSVRTVLRRAGSQARLWSGQNFLLLGWLAMVAVVLWLNALIAVYALPHLLKMFLGMETAFSRASIGVMLNTTFLAVTVGLAWLALDPLVKAVYTLRCFHGEARTDGADLLAELSTLRARGKAATVAMLVLFALPFWTDRSMGATNAVPGAPAKQASPAAAPAVTAAQIDDAVKETLRHDKYAWRLPREQPAGDKAQTNSWLQNFIYSIGNTLKDWARAVWHWLRSVIDWFDKHFMPRPKPTAPGGAPDFGWMGLLRWLIYGLLLVAGVVLVVLIVRLWRQGGWRTGIIRAEVMPARPDLNDESVTAAQLPEDEWLKLARELVSKGDLRLALRAFYLATLAHLSAREIVSIARFKSNHDYVTEVNRRARGSQELRAAFSANVSSFDRAWYGLYDVTTEALAQFQTNFERIRSC